MDVHEKPKLLLEVTQEEYWLLYAAVQKYAGDVIDDNEKFHTVDGMREEFKRNGHLAV